ncbi:YqgE/AlgH family protein [Vibrio sp. Of7-15]|uniref:YqgE/AlgH family protein n=1 Tax=Vibrio sp. Of7-15 TaxID=2724879 RepID=UPI001EF18C25|nr:YqgE/AlgH family protein [Vibrio sp. Of7-15]MCG7499030.1 YqgE/AlgH family protein [Vibrio sp. Of7-15]
MDLTNHFLVAMPNMKDPLFQRGVIYICEHDSDGAMGLLINQPIDISIGEMLDQIEIERTLPINNEHSLKQPVLSGGPVADDRGFVLHLPKDDYGSSLSMTDQITVTTSKDILAILGTESEPDKFLVTLGYAGWDAGQLEKELSENTWLTIEADPAVIFNTPINERWQKAVQQLGINVANLSTEVGHS